MSTNARFSSAAGSDNTDRVRDNQYLTPAYAASLALLPVKSFTLVNVAPLTGAMSVTAGVGSASTPPYVGDRIKLLFSAAATQVVTFSTGFLSAGTLSVAAGKTANATFIFNGASWCEESRTITA